MQWVSFDVEKLVDNGFCQGCPSVTEEADIDYTSCPCCFDPSDENCFRASDYSEIMEGIFSLNQKISLICNV